MELGRASPSPEPRQWFGIPSTTDSVHPMRASVWFVRFHSPSNPRLVIKPRSGVAWTISSIPRGELRTAYQVSSLWGESRQPQTLVAAERGRQRGGCCLCHDISCLIRPAGEFYFQPSLPNAHTECSLETNPSEIIFLAGETILGQLNRLNDRQTAIRHDRDLQVQIDQARGYGTKQVKQGRRRMVVNEESCPSA